MPSSQDSRRAVIAATIGNLLEWFDFGVYGYFAVTIGQTFFPATDPTTSLLASFAAFGVGFLMRPLGGIVIGVLGDRMGRKPAMVLCILSMALGTLMIGLLPGYASIGIAAPVLLVVARLIQGFSAGGDWGGSTAFMVEWAQDGRRGWFGSFQQASVAFGLLLGSGIGALVSSFLTPGELSDWGWRVPFLIGSLLGPFGFYVRRAVDETPRFRATRDAAAVPGPAPGANAGLALRSFGFTIHWTVCFYIFLTYMPTFTRIHAKLTAAEALWSNTIGLIVLVVTIPLMGALSDRIGRRPLLLGSCAAFVVLPLPLLWLITQAPGFATVVVIQIVFGLAISLFSGPGPAAISEIFATRGRSTWMSSSYALAVAVFGGFAPYIATWLIAATGWALAPTFYVIAAAVATFWVVLRLPETAHSSLA